MLRLKDNCRALHVDNGVLARCVLKGSAVWQVCVCLLPALAFGSELLFPKTLKINARKALAEHFITGIVRTVSVLVIYRPLLR